ncbi:MAG: hypothetical protein H6828_01080 [Planctomycetes bacterium]|nr:hypothetical protein [Planctomycetota bacterium]
MSSGLERPARSLRGLTAVVVVGATALVFEYGMLLVGAPAPLALVALVACGVGAYAWWRLARAPLGLRVVVALLVSVGLAALYLDVGRARLELLDRVRRLEPGMEREAVAHLFAGFEHDDPLFFPFTGVDRADEDVYSFPDRGPLHDFEHVTLRFDAQDRLVSHELTLDP